MILNCSLSAKKFSIFQDNLVKDDDNCLDPKSTFRLGKFEHVGDRSFSEYFFLNITKIILSRKEHL